jgi:hypothetical protein
METLERAIVWRNLLTGGTEYFELRGWGDCHILRGKIVSVLEPAQPLLVSYEIACDENWRTRQARILQVNAGEQRELKIEVSGVDWIVNGKPAPELHGCIDIDLSASPSTNTLPLRRLQLPRGQSQPVTAAWVRFPSLEIAPLQQTYKRLDDTRYWYESATGFTAEIRVDACSVVFDYPGVWTRVAQNQQSASSH